MKPSICIANQRTAPKSTTRPAAKEQKIIDITEKENIDHNNPRAAVSSVNTSHSKKRTKNPDDQPHTPLTPKRARFTNEGWFSLIFFNTSSNRISDYSSPSRAPHAVTENHTPAHRAYTFHSSIVSTPSLAVADSASSEAINRDGECNLDSVSDKTHCLFVLFDPPCSNQRRL